MSFSCVLDTNHRWMNIPRNSSLKRWINLSKLVSVSTHSSKLILPKLNRTNFSSSVSCTESRASDGPALHLLHKNGYCKCICFTVDLRVIKAQTKKNLLPSPHADSNLAQLFAAECFFCLDSLHQYCPSTLHESSYKCESFPTMFRYFSSSAVLHGPANSV